MERTASRNAGQSKRTVIVGEALVDLFPDGPVMGGTAFNVARNLAALGAPPLLITRVGQDALGEDIAREFERWNMPREGLQRDAALPTGTVDVLLERDQHRFHVRENTAWDAIESAHAVGATRATDPAIVYFGTLAQRGERSRAAVRDVLEATEALRVLDLNLREGPDNVRLSRESLALANVVKVNDAELRDLLTWFVDRDIHRVAWGTPEHGAAIESLVHQFELRELIVTRGDQGYAAYDARGHCIAAGGVPQVSVVDTVGAGDAFTAVLILGETLGWSLTQTLSRASEYAAAICTLRGAVTRDANFYAPWRERWRVAPATALRA